VDRDAVGFCELMTLTIAHDEAAEAAQWREDVQVLAVGRQKLNSGLLRRRGEEDVLALPGLRPVRARTAREQKNDSETEQGCERHTEPRDRARPPSPRKPPMPLFSNDRHHALSIMLTARTIH